MDRNWTWVLFYAGALGCAAALAVPTVYFMFVLLTFGIGLLVLTGIGVAAFIGPVLVLIHAAILKWRAMSIRSVSTTVRLWLCASIIHLGSSFGFSRMGDVASSMGGRNTSYLEALVFPLEIVSKGLKGAWAA